MTDIFSKHAARYWDAGISVIPLIANKKRPAINEWSDFSDRLPTPEEQQFFLQRYTNNNIGVALGAASGLVFIDIDSVDPKVVAAIESVLPKTPWIRIGAKGCMKAYRFRGEKATKIQDSASRMVVEILAKGNQSVLPPSIHPDTMQPYTSNCDLVDVYHELPYLPDNFEAKLRAALSTVVELRSNKDSRFNTAKFISLGGRDNALVQMAGYMSFSVTNGDITLKDALNHAEFWTKEMTEKAGGDSMDSNKAKAKIIEFVMNDITVRGKTLPPGWDIALTPEEKIQWGIVITEEHEEWTVAQINDYIHGQFSELEINDPKRQDTVNFVLRKISKSHHLTDIDTATVLTNLKKNSGLDLPMSAYVKQLRSLTQGPIEGTNHTDIADETVKLLKERHGEVAYHGENIWKWIGTNWEIMPHQEIWKIIAKEFGNLTAARKASDHKGIIQIMENIIPQKLTEATQKGVNFQNGFLLPDGTLIPHQPEHGMTYMLPYQYKPEMAGKCPMFMHYLQESWGHHPDFVEKKAALQEAMAATLFGISTSYQKAFLLYGPGGSGKSVMLEIIQTLVPEEAKCSSSPDQWGDRFTCANFNNKLLNTSAELHDTKRISGQMFKKIVSGEEMQVEYKNVQGFTMKNRSAQWFASNFLPKSADTSHGFNRRWLIFTFDKVVSNAKIIRDLGVTIAEDEVEGIVAWAVEALDRLMTVGSYTEGATHQAAVKEMSLSNSVIRQWIEEKVEFVDGVTITQKDLYQGYWTFSLPLLSKPPMPAAFRAELNQLLAERGKLEVSFSEKGEVYNNIRIKK